MLIDRVEEIINDMKQLNSGYRLLLMKKLMNFKLW